MPHHRLFLRQSWAWIAPSAPNSIKGSHATTPAYAQQHTLWPPKNPEPVYATAASAAPAELKPKVRPKANMDNPASAAWNKMKLLAAISSGNTVKPNMAGRYIPPDSGSAANGAPENVCGFHPGTCPFLSCSPRNEYQG